LEANVEEVNDVEDRPWNYSSQVNGVCYKLRITRQCTFFLPLGIWIISREAEKRRHYQLSQLNNQSRLRAGKENAKWRRDERGRRSRNFRWEEKEGDGGSHRGR
jgi:hypothetical protein